MAEKHKHTVTAPDNTPAPDPGAKRRRKHLIENTLMRRTLKTLVVIIVVVLLIPMAVYIPPVQTLLKDIACNIVGRSTGMQVSVERFRLKFPLDVQLDGVKIIEATGDTMVTARSLVADLKIIPLLSLDARINKLELIDASYRMLSTDSSMTLRLKARYLRTASGTQFDLKHMHLNLKRPVLRNASVSVHMNVWKQKKDTASSPTRFLIDADRLTLSNVTFAMSMLPTIDTLSVTLKNADVRDARINLTESVINIGTVNIAGGNATYLTPTAEYVRSHPAPADTSASTSSPITVRIGNASLNLDSVLYATRGSTPRPGFDPTYISVRDLTLKATDFFNQSSVLRMPLKSLSAKERSGLEITEATGYLGINSTGLILSEFSLLTPASSVTASASLPFELMALDNNAPAGYVEASGSIGWSDIFAFMPAMHSSLTAFLSPASLSPVNFSIKGGGTLSKIDLEHVVVKMGNFLSLKASGVATSPMQPSRLHASLSFDGAMRDPSATMHLLYKLANLDMHINMPVLRVKGTADIKPGLYRADIDLLTSAGDVAAKGHIRLSPDTYDIHAVCRNLMLGEIMPSLGIGTVTGTIDATGSGFNPLSPTASAHVSSSLQQLSYNGASLAPLDFSATANHGMYELSLRASAPDFNIDMNGSGHLESSTYFADINAYIIYIDFHALGLMDEICRGSGNIALQGNAAPASMLFDLTMNVSDVDWEYADEFYSLPHAFDATFLATSDATDLHLSGDELNVDFACPRALAPLLDDIKLLMPVINAQIAARQVDFEPLQAALPPFSLSLDAQGSGLLHELLESTGFSLSSLEAELSNTDRISGNALIMAATTGEMMLDTVTLALNQRGKLMDYRLHLGNKASNMPEFAQVNATGYVGGNRASIFLRQKNARGETGYRIGLTAAMLDSVLSLHLTPLNAVIAYKDWTINDDNYVELGPGKRIGAFLEASSGESSIALRTTESADSLPALDVDIRNLLIQDFLQLAVSAPPVTGAVNSQMHLVYRGHAVTGKGSIGISGLAYDGNRVGDLDFNFKAGMSFNGNTGASLALLLNKREVLTARGFFIADTTASRVRSVKQRAKLSVELKEFPLEIANPFIDADIMRLAGSLNGSLALTGTMSNPLLNGEITCDSVGIYVPMAASWFRFDERQSIAVTDNVLGFNNFNIHAANSNPILLNGTLDARNLANIKFDITANGENVALINNRHSSGADIYGQLFVTLGVKARGSISRMNIDGNLSILPATNLFYNLSMTASASLSNQGTTTDVVKFVQFSDSLQTARADTLKTSSMAMRITATMNIVNGATFTVNLSGNGTDKVQLYPHGTLSYLHTYMGDMRLNGTLNLGEGFARYSVKVIGEKNFKLDPESYVTWTGDMLNPTLHINATDHLKANVQQEGANSRLIYFDIGLAVTGTLEAPKVTFDLATDDDITVQNELLSMSPEQRSAAAINLLLYNTYNGPGVKASSSLGGNPLYTFLEGQLNSIAAKYVTGVDLSFGIDQYDKTVNGETSGTTSYSYQVSKSLFDNRFKIVVGGNYSTDANVDENFAQNLISDISFEYSIRQTASTNMYVRLFRHTGFESILEGEITETGVGFVLKRKLSNLRSLFRLRRRPHNKPDTTISDTARHDTLPAATWQKVNLPSYTPDSL